MPELGETSDPTALIPGRAGPIQTSADGLTRYGDTLARAGQGLRSLDHGGWKGEAAEAFDTYFEGEPKRWVEAGDAFHAAGAALERYLPVLTWAQDQAAQAIEVWERGQAATERARQRQRSAAAGASAPQTPVSDPGAELRSRAQQMLSRAREQLNSVANEAGRAIVRAQAGAPQERNLLEQALDAAGDLVDEATETYGELARNVGDTASTFIQGAGDVYSGAVSGLGDIAAEAYRTVGGHLPGPWGEAATAFGNVVDSATGKAADKIKEGAESVGNAVQNGYNHFADFFDEDGTDQPQHHYVIVDEDKYPQSAEHVQEAQSGQVWAGDTFREDEPKPSELTIDREGADDNRKESLRGIAPRGSEGLDRDEYPPAMFDEGGGDASVKYIDHSDNRGSGASIRGQTQGLSNGETIHLVAG